MCIEIMKLRLGKNIIYKYALINMGKPLSFFFRPCRGKCWGVGDDGRKFYKCFRAEAIAADFRSCSFARYCYVYEVDGDINDRLLERLGVNLMHEGKFKFCGREYEQHEGFSVFISCRENTEGTLPISLNWTGPQITTPWKATSRRSGASLSVSCGSRAGA